MDDLLSEFLTETNEYLDVVDVELVRFEQDPNNEKILSNIFRLVHTIKGTCGFLGLPRLEALAHAAETLMGQFRDGLPVTSEAVSLILRTLDQIKVLVAELGQAGAEPAGSDAELIGELERMASVGEAAMSGAGDAAPAASAQSAPAPAPAASTESASALQGERPIQVLERDLLPGEVPLDELERAFMEAPGPEEGEPVPAPAAAAPEPAAAPVAQKLADKAPPKQADAAQNNGEGGEGAKVQTIRVNVDTLEHLMTMVSELVLTRNQLLEIARRQEDSAYKVPLQRLSHVTAELQEGVMKTRMQPIGSAWQKLPRIVRDLCNELGKTIDLVMQGAETELDRQVLEVIKDPLTHMIRNSADHGIEMPDERRQLGKPDKGTIRLNAYHEGGTITIEIADDGKGLDYNRIRRKAVEQNLASEADVERMSDAQIAKFIFHPGFSTAKAITSVSGRGVGMDVVKTNIQLIGGTIDIRSEQGHGTTFTIKIPLTLAIVAALIVSAGDQRFAIPQVAVLELVRVKPGSDHTIERINGTPVLRLRDRLLPVVALSKLLHLPSSGGADRDEGFIVVTQVGRTRFGILVDGVFHTEEIVVKPMSQKLRHISLFSGNTILGDGAVVLIIDPNGIARGIGSASSEGQFAMEDTEAGDGQGHSETTTLLVFRASGDGLKAVPLSLVTRLEEVDASKIEWVGGRPLLQYRGRLMPLVAVSEQDNVRREGAQPLVVFSEGDRSMGLIVDEIVDIVEDRLDIELATERPDLVGSAVIRGRATEIINIAHYLPLAHEDWLRQGGKSGAAPSAMRTVMLVDDSAFFRNMLTPVLKAAGFRVIQAASASQAEEIIANGKSIDILVVDVDMPEKGGLDLVESLRKERRFASLPVIALSSHVQPAILDRARSLGVSDFVAKFDRSGLISSLSEMNQAYGEAA